jgi:hypothetical protein
VLVLVLSVLFAQPPEAASKPQLEPVPFPLETKGEEQTPKKTPTGKRVRGAHKSVPIIDLRDPFAVDAQRSRRRGRAALARLGVPDLKDPFSPGRRVVPRGWKVQLPGDIRDPFSPQLKHRYLGPRCVDGQVVRTGDGVQIQRPDKKAGKAEAKACRPAPFDLRDPFQS